jgi:hypothetical protein
MLFERLSDCSIYATMIDDKIQFTIVGADPLPTIDANGIIVIDGIDPTI